MLNAAVHQRILQTKSYPYCRINFIKITGNVDLGRNGYIFPDFPIDTESESILPE